MATIKRASTKPKKKQIERKIVVGEYLTIPKNPPRKSTTPPKDKMLLPDTAVISASSGKRCTAAQVLDALDTAIQLILSKINKAEGSQESLTNAHGVMNMLSESINETYGGVPISLNRTDPRLKTPVRMIFIHWPSEDNYSKHPYKG